MDKGKDKKQPKVDKKDNKKKKIDRKEKSPFIANLDAEEYEEKSLDEEDDQLSETGRSVSSYVAIIEPYVCTGNFIADYEELCRRNDMSYIPRIVPRVKIPLQTVMTPVDPKNKKTKDKSPVEVEMEQCDENKEPIPKTYVLINTREYLKPRIQVEMEIKEKPETITEIYIRGWKMTEEYLTIFQQCWPWIKKLHTINLWNTGLTGSAMTSLASLLPKCVNVKKLFLDATHVEEENYGELLGKDSLLEYVSFRHNRMTKKGTESICRAISDREAIKLTSIILCGNFIGDQGAKHFADALRINRTLLILGLGNNGIGDVGAKYLAEVLSRFALTQPEVAERRKLLAEKGSNGCKNLSPPVSRRSESRDPNVPGSRSTPVADKDKAKKGLKGRKDAKGGKESSGKDEVKGKRDRDSGSVSGGGVHGGGGSGITGGAKKGGAKEADRKVQKNVVATKGVAKTPREVEIQSPTEPVFPLLEPAEYSETDKQLWIPGNRMLKLLDLSRNKITAVGIKYLLDAMLYQVEIAQGHSQNFFPGLLQLRIKKNDVSDDCEYVKELVELMQHREPYKRMEDET